MLSWRPMQRRLYLVAAIVALLVGCGNERNGYHASKTIPASRGTTATMGRPGDHWVDTMQFVRVARAQRDSRYGYEVTYEALGGTTFTLFWSRDQIDLRGNLPSYRLEDMPLGDGRLLYPDKLTQESLPNVFQAIQLIEGGHERDADGAITAAEMFGVVAALGGAAPAPRAPKARIPAPRRVPPSRASVPRAEIVKGGGHAARLITNSAGRTLDLRVFQGLARNPGTVAVGRSGAGRALFGPANSYSLTAGGHALVYGPRGKLLYDVSASRIKVFQWNQAANGKWFPRTGADLKFTEVPKFVLEALGL